MTFNISHLENKRPLEKNEATQQEEASAHKKLKSGTQNGREIGQLASPLLQLPTEILGKIVRCVDWKSRDTLHLTLTCKKLKQIAEARPHVRLAKILTFLDRHPLIHCKKKAHEKLLKIIPFLLSSITVMPEDKISRQDLTYFRNFTRHIARTFLQILLPPSLIPFIIPLVKQLDVSIRDERCVQLPGPLQEAYQLKKSNMLALKNLLKDVNWTQEKIDSIDWSLISREASEYPVFINNIADFDSLELFSTPLWWQNIYNIYRQKPLPEACLLILLCCSLDVFETVTNRLVINITSDKSNDPNFMLQAIAISRKFFKYCSPKLKQDRAFLLQAARTDGHVLSDLPPINDVEILLAAAQCRKTFFHSCGHESSRFGATVGPVLQQRLQADKEFLLAFLKSFQPYIGKSLDPAALFPPSFSLSPELADDEELMKEAIPYIAAIWQYASLRIKNSKEMALFFLQYRGHLSAIPKDLLTDEDIVNRYVETTGDLASVLPTFRKRKDLALKAIEKNWEAICAVDDSLKKDRDFISAAANRNPLVLLLSQRVNKYHIVSQAFPSLRKMIKELRQNRELVLRFMKIPKDRRYIRLGKPWPDSSFLKPFKKDSEVLLAAASQYPQIIRHIDPELLAQEQFVDDLFHLGLTHLNLDLMPHPELDKQEMNDPMEIVPSSVIKPMGLKNCVYEYS